MTCTICLFEVVHLNNLHYLSLLVHLNDLLFDEWVDHAVKEVLKASIFIVQKAAAPKNGVEFHQGSNGTIRISIATLHDITTCNN